MVSPTFTSVIVVNMSMTSVEDKCWEVGAPDGEYRVRHNLGHPPQCTSLPLAPFCCRFVYYFHNAVGVILATTITHVYSSKEALTLFAAEATLVDLQGLPPISLRLGGSQSQICRRHRFHYTNKPLVQGGPKKTGISKNLKFF